ncbi:response regulator [Flavobacterium johnsoniae]|uniref:Response regulator receiver domain-containing protein n=1 Tax=Flavobacterium johnsoniae TaxID=986 RepID=A0A1M5QS07_FLAJO|nr:response regulator [Flavobacterium johnsoniae]SHH16897.1 Response regulator receiver domain-containing protein [Flavobacterium johnsoniae]
MPQKQISTKIIYHADDDEDDRLLFIDAVSELDLPVRVQQAQDGQQLLDFLYGGRFELPEIIFLDINMPVKNGFECLKEIRSGHALFNDIKVIMFSTSRSTDNINLSYELGADFYAVKPSTYKEFKELLQSVMEMDLKYAARNKTKFLLF